MARDEDNPGNDEDECSAPFLWSTGNTEETRDPELAEEEDTRDEDWEDRTPHPLMNEDDIQNSDDLDSGSEEEENSDSDSESEEEEDTEDEDETAEVNNENDKEMKRYSTMHQIILI